MASLARKIPFLPTHQQDCGEGGGRLCPPANEEQMAERLMRAAAFLKLNPIPLVISKDLPEVNGGAA